MVVTYVFLALFLGMIAYSAYFIYKKADTYRSNPYNAKRQAVFENKYLRGSILASDGTELARTVVDDEGETVREYPYGRMYAHIVGYTPRGGAGIERTESAALLTSHGNGLNDLLLELQDKKIPADNVVTTLIPRVQEAAYEALGDRRGAVIVLEPSTGKVLACVSKPDYDPNSISEDWDEIVEDADGAARLVNRATQGLYPPGSTFKTLTLLGFLRQHAAEENSFVYNCTGAYTVGEYSIRCAHDYEHGEQNLRESYANSCNGAFAMLGQSLDYGRIWQMCEDFGFNKALPGPLSGSVSRFTLKNNNDLWAVLQTSIGQGETLVTPLHMAMITAAVTNHGRMMVPYVVEKTQSAAGTTVSTVQPQEWRTVMTDQEAAKLKTYMRDVVTEGTGTEAEGEGYIAAGKTGTAQYNSEGASHAWFTGYAGRDEGHTDIVVSIIIEGGESGGGQAAPIAREVFDAYYYG